jgi:UDP-glucose 4-epimerase
VKILVTGGAGYIGGHVTRHLLAAGHEVWVYDNLSRGHRSCIAAERLVVADLLDRAAIENVLRERQIDAVVHLAALTYVGESIQDPGHYYENNVVGTINLLEAMRKFSVDRIVFSSTAAVYGNPEGIPIDESAIRQPINPYGRTKHIIEQMLADYATAYGIGYVALRYFNAAGADPQGDIGEDHNPETHLIPLILQVALGQRSHVNVFGTDYPTPDGTCIRDYIHVNDLADAHLRALERIRAGKGIALNLGTGRGYSVKTVISTCEQVCGMPIAVVNLPPRIGDPAELVASSQLAMQELDWTPKYTHLQDIVATAWNWHRQHARIQMSACL